MKNLNDMIDAHCNQVTSVWNRSNSLNITGWFETELKCFYFEKLVLQFDDYNSISEKEWHASLSVVQLNSFYIT